MALVSLVIVSGCQIHHLVENSRFILRDHRLNASESFGSAPRSADTLLSTQADLGALIQTFRGWVAHRVRTSPIEETYPITTWKPKAAPAWAFEGQFSSTDDEPAPAAATTERDFASKLKPSSRSTTYRFVRNGN